MSNEHWTQELTTVQLIHCVRANMRYFNLQAEFLQEQPVDAQGTLIEAVKRDLINSWQTADEAAQSIIVRLASHE